jgi:hypothetical protein
MTRASRGQQRSRRLALAVRWLALAVRRLARRIADVLAECRYSQRRVEVLRASPDRYLLDPGRAPQTYREFLFRTSGPLVREPAAASRSRGHAVR